MYVQFKHWLHPRFIASNCYTTSCWRQGTVFSAENTEHCAAERKTWNQSNQRRHYRSISLSSLSLHRTWRRVAAPGKLTRKFHTPPKLDTPGTANQTSSFGNPRAKYSRLHVTGYAIRRPVSLSFTAANTRSFGRKLSSGGGSRATIARPWFSYSKKRRMN